MDWMIYGANGYTGRLTAREAVRRGMRPILAGRNEAEIRSLAKDLGLEYRVFGLDEAKQAMEFFVREPENCIRVALVP